jgi:hypothetical protein
MTADKKLAQKRLTLLQLAEKLGNVSRACRMHNISRSQFYEYKRGFQEHGLDGLVNKPPVPASYPREIDKGVKTRIIELSLEHPAFGQQRISDQFALEGVSACPTTVRNVWLKDGMETRYKQTAAGNDIELTKQQIRLMERANPELRERHVESIHSGCLLCQNTFYVVVSKV